jgi:hypothetical protein
MLRRGLLIAGLGIWFLIGAVFLIGCSSSEERAAPSQVRQAFQIFATDPDHLPDREELLIQANIGAFRSSSPLSRVHLVPTEHGRLWLFTTSNLVCLAHQRGAACAPILKAKKVGVFLSVFRPPTELEPRLHDFLVLGLVPDGVRKVIASADGHRLAANVEENTFSLAGDQPIQLQRLQRR